jgi:hypothetical protein
MGHPYMINKNRDFIYPQVETWGYNKDHPYGIE